MNKIKIPVSEEWMLRYYDPFLAEAFSPSHIKARLKVAMEQKFLGRRSATLVPSTGHIFICEYPPTKTLSGHVTADKDMIIRVCFINSRTSNIQSHYTDEKRYREEKDAADHHFLAFTPDDDDLYLIPYMFKSQWITINGSCRHRELILLDIPERVNNLISRNIIQQDIRRNCIFNRPVSNV